MRGQREGGPKLVLAYKLDAAPAQDARMDAAIRSAQFVRKPGLRLWMDGPGTTANDLQVQCSHLAHDFPCAAQLNSQARQAAADRAGQVISRFYMRSKAKTPGKKGYPRFQHAKRSVEYTVTGWKLDPDGRHRTFTEGCGIGRVRRVGTRSIETYPLDRLKRVRLKRVRLKRVRLKRVRLKRRAEMVTTPSSGWRPTGRWRMCPAARRWALIWG